MPGHVMHITQRLAPTRPLRTILVRAATLQARTFSLLEVERKFVPARNFRDQLQVLQERANEQWKPEKRSTIHDTYFDLNDQLSAKGIWIRRRTVRSPGRSANPSNQGNWDAKIRVGGDFIQSEFLELSGESEIRAVVSRNLPNTSLEDLQVMADLNTERSEWSTTISMHLVETTRPQVLSIVLDSVSAAESSHCPSRSVKPFSHIIGEVEIAMELEHPPNKSDHVNFEADLRRRMRSQLGELMRSKPALFLDAEPIGKLSAYLAWRRSEDAS